MTTEGLINAIAEAILLGQDAEVKRLLTEHPEQLHGRHGFKPWLLTAADMENVALVQWLLDRGCDINAEEGFTAEDPTGPRLTALDSAVGLKDTTLARLLLERGINPNQGRQLISAITEGSLEMVGLLVQYGADIHLLFENELNNTPMNALSTAVDWGHEDIADYLRARGAVLPTALPEEPAGPKKPKDLLAEAVQSGDVECARHLLSQRPELVHKTFKGDSWLHIAASNSDAAMVKLLLEMGCDVNARNPWSDATPLQLANKAAAMKCLLDHHADPNAAPMACQVTSGLCAHGLEMLRLLERYGSDLHARLDFGDMYNALQCALEMGRISDVDSKEDVVRFLRSRGLTENGQPGVPLKKQVDATEAAIVEGLRTGDVAHVRQLLTRHPELIPILHEGHTCLQIAAHYPSLEMAELLIELGCDVNAEGWNHFVALDAAVGSDDPAMVRLLLEHGADPNHGKPVLWTVPGHGRHTLELLRLLEQYGADLNRSFINEAREKKKKVTPLTVAKQYDRPEVAEYLRSRMKTTAKVTKPAPSELKDEILAHFTEQFGPVWKPALMEIVPTEPSIHIHVIPPTTKHNYVTLFTVGMSAQPMTVPPGGEDFQYAELFGQLPVDWPYKRLDDPQHTWPIRWLRSTAQYPFHNDTWLGGRYAIVANDDPPQPLAPNLPFTCLLVLAKQSFVARDGRKIQLYRMMPLYTEERDLEIREGIDAVLRAFAEHGIAFVVDPKRRSVAARKSSH